MKIARLQRAVGVILAILAGIAILTISIHVSASEPRARVATAD